MKRIRFSTLQRILKELDYEIENTVEGVSRGMNKNIQSASTLLNSLNRKHLVRKVDKKIWLSTNKVKNPKCFTTRNGKFYFLTEKGNIIKESMKTIARELEVDWIL